MTCESVSVGTGTAGPKVCTGGALGNYTLALSKSLSKWRSHQHWLHCGDWGRKPGIQRRGGGDRGDPDTWTVDSL